MLTGPFSSMQADRAFTHVARARRRAALGCRMLRRRSGCDRLTVYEPVHRRGAVVRAERVEIPLDAIRGTLEPGRAALFDPEFRPAPLARGRWERVWLAEERGAVLPPLAVARVDDGYAIRDGHHRVSVARARGAIAIDAVVDR